MKCFVPPFVLLIHSTMFRSTQQILGNTSLRQETTATEDTKKAFAAFFW
jgi:hypothetical protein